MKNYSAPTLTAFGSVADITRASQNSNNQDSVICNGTNLGNQMGSTDRIIQDSFNDCTNLP